MNTKSKASVLRLWFDKITIKKISILLLILYLFSLIPVLALGHYNFPSADDFSVTAPARQAWITSGSLGQTLAAVFSYAGYHYFNWSGDFATTVLGMLQPAIFGEQYAAWNPYLLIGALSISIYLFVYFILVRFMHVDKYLALIPATVYLFLAVHRPVSGVEAFYWYAGASKYLYPVCFALLFFICLSIYVTSPGGRKKMVMLLFLTLLESLIGLGTYLIALNFLIINLTVLFLLYRGHRKKEFSLFFIPFAVYIVSFLTNVLAPGNQYRMAVTNGYSPVKSILISFSYALEYPAERWMDFTLIACMIFLLPFLWKIAASTNYSFSYPLLVALYSYCLFAALFTPALVGSGSADAGRLQNEIYFVFLLLLIGNLFYTLGWLYRKLYQAGYLPAERELSDHGKMLTLTMIVFLAFGIVVMAVPNPDHYTVSSALTSLLSGEAKIFRTEMEERLVLLHDDSIMEAELAPLSERPWLLYFSDIKTDPEDWENKAMSRYYGKNSIVIKE